MSEMGLWKPMANGLLCFESSIAHSALGLPIVCARGMQARNIKHWGLAGSSRHPSQ
jgi:hypothetical protein